MIGNMKCSICGSDNLIPYLSVKNHRILKCGECTHGLLDRKTQPAYDSSFFQSHYDRLVPGSREFRIRILRQRKRLRKIGPLKRGTRLLDVGCGMGHFLYAAKQAGCKVTACDFTEANRSYIVNDLGIPMLPAGNLEEQLAGHVFDVITFWHSLEHSPDPRASLHAARKALRPGGVLVVEVPTHDCLDALEAGADWPHWDPPFHEQHFTRSSLHRLLAEQGFTNLRESTGNSDYIRNVLKKTLFAPLARGISRAFRGNSVVCVCRVDPQP